MGLFFQVLVSGSKGNSVYVSTGHTRVLVDVGLSGRRACGCLERIPGDAHRLDALLISHEHSDHVRGVGVMSRRFNLPVFMTQGTRECLPSATGRLVDTCLFEPDRQFSIGDLLITPFAVSHDAAEPVGFVMEADGCRLGICMDLGIVSESARKNLQGCHALILEANYDLAQLVEGPYPEWLKQRIRGPLGHLCNTVSCDFLQSLYHDNLRAVVFAHLSETNNSPSLVRQRIESLRVSHEWKRVRFEVAGQHEGAPGIDIF